MPQPRRRFPVAAPVVEAGLTALRSELGVPASFPAEVERAAAGAVAAGARSPAAGGPARTDRRDLPLVTIDPPGARDLDQALAVEEADGGHVVWYAIADVAAFVSPGDPVDDEARARGVTLYAPDGTAPLHPPVLSEGAASLLPGLDRPAVLWRLTLDPDGALVDTTVGRAVVRSREQLDYATAQARIDAGDPALSPLRVVGGRRLALQAARGGVDLPLPDQDVIPTHDGYRLVHRAPLPVEAWNAQLSLLTGMAAAEEMLAGGWGLLRTLPPASPEAIGALRRHARALGIEWSADERYATVVSRQDPADPAAAAFLVQATRLFRGAGYLALRPGSSEPLDVVVHAAIAAPYAHVTAPLRRLGDRFATEVVLALVAGDPPPGWVLDALDTLPGLIASGTSRASALERAAVDLVEALVLSDAVGERFAAVVVDHRGDDAVVQVADPAVVATVPGHHPLGASIEVLVAATDPVARTVTWRVG